MYDNFKRFADLLQPVVVTCPCNLAQDGTGAGDRERACIAGDSAGACTAGYNCIAEAACAAAAGGCGCISLFKHHVIAAGEEEIRLIRLMYSQRKCRAGSLQIVIILSLQGLQFDGSRLGHGKLACSAIYAGNAGAAGYYGKCDIACAGTACRRHCIRLIKIDTVCAGHLKQRLLCLVCGDSKGLAGFFQIVIVLRFCRCDQYGPGFAYGQFAGPAVDGSDPCTACCYLKSDAACSGAAGYCCGIAVPVSDAAAAGNGQRGLLRLFHRQGKGFCADLLVVAVSFSGHLKNQRTGFGDGDSAGTGIDLCSTRASGQHAEHKLACTGAALSASRVRRAICV
ncbi:hypothetical protein SDC9_99909 [bioreactor metagenome]|uniref:Uncharacterized protein n=1 Tax=bioreactor metagenome TaxID=1076179 RepID=A0A645AU91_9ZZZZ